MDAQEFRSEALQKVSKLGPSPSTPSDAAQWRERRDSAIASLAALADKDPAMLRQAVRACQPPRDNAAEDLPIEACGYCPNAGAGRKPRPLSERVTRNEASELR